MITVQRVIYIELARFLYAGTDAVYDAAVGLAGRRGVGGRGIQRHNIELYVK